ncbi:MAG: SIMPL domain-containing protein [Desulfobacterales bacterium]
MKPKVTLCMVVALFCIGIWVDGQAEPFEGNEYAVTEPSTLTVGGRGEVSVAPDRAVLRLGAVAQAAKASEAQSQVNQVVQRIIKDIKSQGIEGKNIATIDLSIYPVYGNQQPEPQEQSTQPVIRGYRASNIIRVQIEELARLGGVIDAGLNAGANRIEGLSFDLKDDGEFRAQALRLATEEADAKANAIARAMGVEIVGIKQISEAGISLVRPQMDSGLVFSARNAATPVQAGQVRVEASLTVTYYITDAEPPESGTNSVSSANSK